jgi:hypothetical protein
LEEVCGDSADTILLTDWGALEAVVASIAPKNSTIIPGSDVRIQVTLAKSPIGMRDELYLHLVIRNMGDDIIRKGTRIEVGFRERKRSHDDDDDDDDDDDENLSYEPDLKILDKDIAVGRRHRIPDKPSDELEEEDLEDCFMLEPIAHLSLLKVNPQISIRLVKPRTKQEYEVTSGNRVVLPLSMIISHLICN